MTTIQRVLFLCIGKQTIWLRAESGEGQRRRPNLDLRGNADTGTFIRLGSLTPWGIVASQAETRR
jgi:hypothetical protein